MEADRNRPIKPPLPLEHSKQSQNIPSVQIQRTIPNITADSNGVSTGSVLLTKLYEENGNNMARGNNTAHNIHRSIFKINKKVFLGKWRSKIWKCQGFLFFSLFEWDKTGAFFWRGSFLGFVLPVFFVFVFLNKKKPKTFSYWSWSFIVW